MKQFCEIIFEFGPVVQEKMSLKDITLSKISNWPPYIFYISFVCLFVWFDSLRPIDNLSIKQGRVLLVEPVLG